MAPPFIPVMAMLGFAGLRLGTDGVVQALPCRRRAIGCSKRLPRQPREPRCPGLPPTNRWPKGLKHGPTMASPCMLAAGRQGVTSGQRCPDRDRAFHLN